MLFFMEVLEVDPSNTKDCFPIVSCEFLKFGKVAPIVIGKTVFVRVKLNWGTTTSGGTGDWRFSLPVNAQSPDGVQFPCSISDNGLNWYAGVVNGTYTGAVDKTSIITTTSPSAAITATIPFTWGNLDSLVFNGSYEGV